MAGQAAKVIITERQQAILQRMSRSVTIAFRLRQRGQIILLSFEGRLNSEIEDIVGLGHDAHLQMHKPDNGTSRMWRRSAIKSTHRCH